MEHINHSRKLSNLSAHEVDFANKPELHNSAQELIDGSINADAGLVPAQ